MLRASSGRDGLRAVSTACVLLPLIAGCAGRQRASDLPSDAATAPDAHDAATSAPYEPLRIGCNWPYEPTPAEKALLYETGFNYARLTGGGYNWSLATHQARVSELAEHGIDVVLQLGSHYPSADYFKLQSSYFVDQAGQTGVADTSVWAITYSGQSWPQYSYFSDEFRTALEKDFTAYLAGFAGKANVTDVILHNEPGYFWMKDRLFDYGGFAVSAYRRWLSARYSTVQDLNTQWGTSFPSFDAVTPIAELPPVSNVASWLEWRRFHAQGIAAFLDWERALATKLAPSLATTTNLSGPLDGWHPWRISDNDAYSRPMARAGIDLYMDGYRPAQFTGYALDMTRGVARDRPFQVLESDVFDPAKFTRLTETQAAAVLESHVLTEIGHGARGVLLWWGGGGAYELIKNGAYNPRLGAMREVTHWSAMQQAGAFHVPARRVALVIDPDAYFFYSASVADQPWWLDQSAIGLYSALIDAQYDVDVVFADQVRRGEADAYAALVFAQQTLVDAPLADRVKAFVERGGLVIAQAQFAELSGLGAATNPAPALGLDAVFGVRATSTPVAADQSLSSKDGVLVGRRVRARVSPTTASVIGRFADNSPALTENAFGKGRAVYIGSEVGLAIPEGRSHVIQLFADELARTIGSPDVVLTHSGARFVDATALEDSAGNTLIIVTEPPERDGPLTAVDGVTLRVASKRIGGASKAYIFRPTSIVAGRTISAFDEIPLSNTDAQLALGTLQSVTMVLLARDAKPLLGLDAPATATAGATLDVTATLINPSPRALTAQAGLVLSAASSPIPTQSVSVPAFASTKVKFTVVAPSSTARFTVAATLTGARGEVLETGIAHDVTLQ